MLGLMQQQPLLISSLLTFAARHHGAAEIVSNTVEGPRHRYTYRDAERRARRLARALERLGVNQATASAPSPGTATVTTSSTSPSPAWVR